MIEIIQQQTQEIFLLNEEIRRLKNLPKNPYPTPKKTHKKEKHPLHPKSKRNSKPESTDNNSSSQKVKLDGKRSLAAVGQK